MKTCYYVLLGVEQTCGDSELKKAYRRKALELHPDKNMHRISEATELFAVVQEAYSVLADPHERAWYDSHRHAILREDGDEDFTSRGSSGGSGVYSGAFTHPDSLMSFFSSKCYRGFDDAHPESFFTIYGALFSKLYEEEVRASCADPEALDTSPSVKSHFFGTSSTPYQPVLRDFYAEWGGFTSVKSFRWHDKYNLAQADDRRTRRWMEKENAKIRDAARRSFVETMQELVAYVKKRDPRHKCFLEESKANRASRLKAESQKRMYQREEMRKEVEAYIEPEWMTAEMEAELLDESYLDPSSVSASNSKASLGFADDEPLTVCEDELLECVVCDKFFKSEKQFQNHEQSKKHQQNLKALRKQMLQDDDFDFSEIKAALPEAETGIEIWNASDAINEDISENYTSESHKENEVEEISYPVNSPISGNSSASAVPVLVETMNVDDNTEDTVISSESPKMSKNEAAAAKREKRKEQRKEKRKVVASTVPLGTKIKGASTSQNTCVFCRTVFASRTKLFEHLRDSGHAILK